MKHLNLLPPERRGHLKREASWGAIIKILRSLAYGVGIVTVTAVVSWALIWILSVLATQSNQSQLTQEIQAYNDVSRVIDDRNEVLLLLAERGNRRIVWAEKIAQVLERMPADSEVQSISADGDGGELTIIGQVPLRSALVVLEENVREIGWVESVDAPRDNLLSPINPQFQFVLKVKRDGQAD